MIISIDMIYVHDIKWCILVFSRFLLFLVECWKWFPFRPLEIRQMYPLNPSSTICTLFCLYCLSNQTDFYLVKLRGRATLKVAKPTSLATWQTVFSLVRTPVLAECGCVRCRMWSNVMKCDQMWWNDFTWLYCILLILPCTSLILILCLKLCYLTFIQWMRSARSSNHQVFWDEILKMIEIILGRNGSWATNLGIARHTAIVISWLRNTPHIGWI